MLTLNDGRAELWQWDTGRTLTVDADCSQVHFSNKVFGRSIDVDVAGGVAIIPDVLLQTDNDLNVWAFVGTAENGYTKISKTFKVNRRNKPSDYAFTPVEQTTIAEIAAIAQSVRDDADAGLFNGKRGDDGGWYTPSVTQPDENTLRMAFAPSKEGMPDVAHTDITLPGGDSGSVAVDSTLTVSGQAADAKVTGDALRLLSEEIANLQTSGLTTEQINALDGMFKVCAFTKADVSAEYNAFCTAFGIEAATITGISATYSGGAVAVGTAVTDLTGIVVTANYSDGTSQTVTGYTLSGTIAEGSNTVTVTYQGKTATFTVTGVAESGGGDEPVDTTAKIAGTGYGLNSKGGLQSLEKACYTEFYSFGRTIEGSDSRKVIYYVSTGNQGGMLGADKQTVYQDGEFVTYWTTKFDSVNENNFTGNYGPFNQLRFSLVTAYIDDDYAYFAATGEVIFAGKNTPYYGMANIDGTMAVKV